VQSGSDFFQQQILTLPNLNWAGGTSRPRYFQIRGTGDTEQYEGAPNSSVAVILDEVDVTGVGAALTLFDIEQLELHRGPQPIRFGSSALAGALNLTSAEPTSKYTGTGLISVGNDNLIQGGGALGGAVSQEAQFRISAFGHKQDGFRHNEFLNSNSTNDRDEFTGRAKLKITPWDNFNSLTLSVISADLNNGFDAFSVQNKFITQSDRPGEDEQRFRLVSLTGKFSVDDSTELLSVTSYYQSKLNYSFDGDWGNNPFWAPFTPYDFFSSTNRSREVLAQQVRTVTKIPTFNGSLSWMNGIFIQDLSENTATREFSDNEQYDSLDEYYDATTAAVFSNISAPVSSQVTLSIGGRIERRLTDYKDSRDSLFTPADTMTGGLVSAQYHWTENSHLYGLISRGFRGGGFNSGPNVPLNFKEYTSENLINYEIGVKSYLLERKVNHSLSLFTQARRDQQIGLSIQDDPSDPLSFTYITENAAKGRTYGLENEIDYTVTERLNLNTTLGLLDTELTEVDPLLATLEGRAQAHAPRWQYSASTSYKFTDNITGSLGIAGRGSFYFGDSHNSKSSPYHLINANIAYKWGTWTAQIWGRNLTDEQYAVRGFFFGNEPPDFSNKKYVQLGDPLTTGVTIIYNF
jgi:outer membrane receptor protein involved in Fe transport